MYMDTNYVLTLINLVIDTPATCIYDLVFLQALSKSLKLVHC